MISHLSGILESIDKGRVTLDVGDVGYEVNIPLSEATKLPKKGEKVKIYTVQVVREDDISLYGFLTREARSLFSLLLTVNGIGPKVAMNLIGSFPLDKLVAAIAKGNVDLIVTAQGVGRKTAQKLVIELKEKVGAAYGILPSDAMEGIPGEDPMFRDVVSALMTLGYSPREARDALLKSGIDFNKEKNIEEIIKASLKTLG
ncbi:MAG: Holliday junction branch migration protein RuvA [Candidatus Saganbacteria bacterium]|nr:Holliday junction branch migration protein RuvA [Candidatus Saganbacteria bacterium]